MTTALILSSDEPRAWQIREALTAADVEIGQVFATSHTLLHRLTQNLDQRPDLLVVDEHSTPMNQWDLIRELGVRHPTAAVLAVVTDPQPEDYASALSNGARGVIRYPLSYEEIASLVETAVGWSSLLRDAVRTPESGAERGGRILAVTGAKGGTGTSTVALHLALQAVSAKPDDNIVLIDFDLQKPDQSVLLDVPRSRDLTDLLGVVEELTPRHLEDVVFSHPSGLRMLLGPRHGEQGELVTEFAARQIVSMLATRSDLVIMDLGSVIGEAGATALEMADDILVVSTPDVLSLRGVHRLTELWDRLGIRAEGSTRVLLNRVSRRNDLSPDAARKIVRQPVLDAVLAEETAGLEAAVNRRDPALVTAAWVKDVQTVSQELGTVPPPTLSSAPRRSRLSKKKGGGIEAPPATGEDGRDSADGPGVVEATPHGLHEGAGAPGAADGQVTYDGRSGPASNGDHGPADRPSWNGDGQQPGPVYRTSRGGAGLSPGTGDRPTVAPPPPDQPPLRPRSGPRRLNRGRAEHGAVSIETLGIMGMFGAIAAIAFQMVLVGVTVVLADHAANEGARAAAVGGSAQSAATAATPDGWSDDLSVSTSGDRVEVEMTAPTLIPIMEDFAFTIPADAGIVEEPQ